MGLEDREWNRHDGGAGAVRRNLPGALIAVAVIAGVVLAGGALKVLRGPQPSFESHRRTLLGDAKVSLLPGTPSLTLRRKSLYWPDDKWTEYLAPERTCPGGERTDLPLAEQADVMVCLVNYARARRGLSRLEPVGLLNDTSLAKAAKIVRCREFEHAACGDDPAADARDAGYVGAFGENLYIADGRWRAPRVALDGWLNSPGHRENLFRPQWRTQGIAVETIPRFGDYRDAALWVNQFGT
jgi:uncharacterized protein YkwD